MREGVGFVEGTFKHSLSTGSEVGVSIGDTVKDWLGSGEIVAQKAVNPVTHPNVWENDFLQSLPRPHLDEPELRKRLQMQLRAGMQTLQQPPQPMEHPAHVSHLHLPDTDIQDSGARWFLLPTETSMVAEATEADASADTAEPEMAARLTDVSGCGSQHRQWQSPVSLRDHWQENGRQLQCKHCRALQGRPHEGSFGTCDDMERSYRDMPHSRDTSDYGLLQQPHRLSPNCARTHSRPGSAGHDSTQSRRPVDHSGRERSKTRPTSAKRGVGSRESCVTPGRGKQVDGMPGSGKRGPVNAHSMPTGETRITGRLAAAVAHSSAKGKSMNDSDRARAAIAAGKAALATSMRRRQLRSCPPR